MPTERSFSEAINEKGDTGDNEEGAAAAAAIATNAAAVEAQVILCFKEAQSIGQEIEKRATNYGKEPLKRRTRELLQSYGKSFDSLWQNFCENHGKIENLITDRQVAYFSENYYGVIQKLYNKMQARVNSDLQSFKPHNFQLPPQQIPLPEQSTPKQQQASKNASSAHHQAEWQAILKLLNNILAKAMAKSSEENVMVEDFEFIATQCDKYFDSFSMSHVKLMSVSNDEEGKFKRTMERKKMNIKPFLCLSKPKSIN